MILLMLSRHLQAIDRLISSKSMIIQRQISGCVPTIISLYTGIPEFRETLEITLEGEVQFPGVYTFTRGETPDQCYSASRWFDSAGPQQSGSIYAREPADPGTGAA